jgi:hypothetical protein
MKKFAIELKWGIIFVIVALLWMYFEKLLGWHYENISSHPIYTNFFAIIAILIFVFALVDKRKNYYGGKMTWVQGFITGLIISIVVTILSPLSQYITHHIISPEYFTNIIEYSVDSGEMTREQAQNYFTLKNYIFMSAGSGLIMGVITSAVVALFVKRK